MKSACNATKDNSHKKFKKSPVHHFFYICIFLLGEWSDKELESLAKDERLTYERKIEELDLEVGPT